ncbi:hypothetical protein BDP27DRAFT_99303 [Rhodocollybia butyracea]|uniref:Uncharacterized protein n=1 Tax=Rhodocollybia butyracea TaxID=206335 RepID=A0A9P5Q5A7_9AGAR|nr:hypothetical protein BDP27DRAFT_99303 [Rhodocollybia butyracea]
MLARISKGTAHALGLTFTRSSSTRRLQDSVSVEGDSEEVIIDLDVLLLPVHDFLVPWLRYADQCRRTIAPVYHNLQNILTLSEDVERIAQLLLSLESSDEDDPYDYDDTDSCIMNLGPDSQSIFPYLERPPHRQQYHPKTPVVIPGSHASIPTIIITPCESQARETSALAPIQDSAFGSQLTIPCHPKINHAFPPMASNAPSIYMNPTLDWTWRNGHWQAILPRLDEQMVKEMFSRPISRRRGSRRRTSTFQTLLPTTEYC